MASNKINRAECILGMLFGFREAFGEDDNLNKATWAFKDYVDNIRPRTPKFSKEFLKLVEAIDLKDKVT